MVAYERVGDMDEDVVIVFSTARAKHRKVVVERVGVLVEEVRSAHPVLVEVVVDDEDVRPRPDHERSAGLGGLSNIHEPTSDLSSARPFGKPLGTLTRSGNGAGQSMAQLAVTVF